MNGPAARNAAPPGLATLDTKTLEGALYEAHARNDVAALCALNAEAARRAEVGDNIDACCFFLTQAWVYALHADLPEQYALLAKLQRYARV